MNRVTGFTKCLLAAASLSLVGLVGCDNPKPGETAGKKVDQTMEKVTQKVDQAAERAKEQAAVAGKVVEDAKITAAVKAGILAEPGLKVLQIDVDTKDGKVTLTGSADSAASVERAKQVASNVEGVKSVDNRLAVSSKS
jgi:osmotically-inducible protein OsmY